MTKRKDPVESLLLFSSKIQTQSFSEDIKNQTLDNLEAKYD